MDALHPPQGTRWLKKTAFLWISGSHSGRTQGWSGGDRRWLLQERQEGQQERAWRSFCRLARRLLL